MILMIPFVGGFEKMEKAKKIAKKAKKHYKKARKSAEKAQNYTNQLAEEYGQLQQKVKLNTIGRFIKYIESIGRRGNQNDMYYLEGLEEFSPEQIKKYKASTIEEKQTLATLGTGGIALGSLALGGIFAIPAVILGGFLLEDEGKKVLKKARKYRAKVDIEIAKFKAYEDFLGQVQRQINELTTLVNELDSKATPLLTELESKEFDSDRDAKQFQQVGLLITALSETIKTPILDGENHLNPAAATIKAKYSQMGE